MNDMTPTAGHNGGPALSLQDPNEVIKQFSEKMNDFYAKSKKWAEVGTIPDGDSEQAKMLSDYISGARDLKKDIEATRVDMKKPLDVAASNIQTVFLKRLTALDAMIKSTLAIQTNYLARAKALAAAEKAERARIAEEKRKAAEEAAKAAEESEDFSDVLDAADLSSEADAAEKIASAPIKAAVESHSGAGRGSSLREYDVVQITNSRLLMMHYQADPDLIACLQRLAERDVRSTSVDHTKIPGITISKTERAV